MNRRAAVLSLTLLVQNLSPAPYSLEAGQGRLTLPDGLSLAPGRTAVQGPVVSGGGLHSVYDVGPHIQVTEDLTYVDGTPINVFADGFGALQVRYDNQTSGLFYDPEQNPAHAGLEIVEGFAFGDELAPGVAAHEVGVLTPEETALHIEDRALLFADCVVRGRHGELGFVPDPLLGDDPQAIRAGLRARFRALAEALEFDALLMAHGAPLAPGGRSALLTFATAPTAGAPPA